MVARELGCDQKPLFGVFRLSYKGPCGHDNPSFGIFAPNHFCRMSHLRNLKAPAGMTTRRSGLLAHLSFGYG